MDGAAPVIPSKTAESGDQSKIYFAARTGDALASGIFEKKREYERFVEQCGLMRLWRKMHWRFYGADPNTGWTDQEVGRDGQEGELHLLMMNHLRADITLWLNLAFSQRSELNPEATVDDYEAELEVKRARAALEHFSVEAEVESKELLAGEYAGVYGASWILKLWNPSLGEMVAAPETDLEGPSAGVRAGAMEAWALSPMDTFFDPWARGQSGKWILHRIPRNRFDLIAEHSELAEQILSHRDADETKDVTNTRVDLFSAARQGFDRAQAPDEVFCYVFIHDDTPAVPGGRIVTLLSEKLVLSDEPLTARYESRPSRRLAVSEIHRTPFGYSPAWSLLAPQEAQSSLSTIALSNSRQFGLGVIVAPKGGDIDEHDLGQGLKLVEFTPGMEPPRALTMPTTPDQVFGFRTALINEMGTLIGVNSVVRGDPEASLKSGSALALVQAQAVQFSQQFQANIVVWKERHHLDTVRIASMNMQEALVPEIAGDYQAALLEPFTGDQFKRIKKVKVVSVNPMAKTLAGKVQIADTLAERFPNQMRPGDYMRVLETGSIEYMTRGATQRAACIDRENELLAAGIGPVPMGPVVDPLTGQPAIDPESGGPAEEPKPEPGKRYVRALITDDHREHVRKHLEVLDNPAIRESQDPKAQAVLDAVFGHVEEHEQLLILATQTRLSMLELTEQMPLQSALPPPMPDAGGGGGGEAPPKGGDGAKGPPPAGSPAPSMQPTPAGSNQLPRAPQMPVNPSTGQRVEEMPGP